MSIERTESCIESLSKTFNHESNVLHVARFSRMYGNPKVTYIFIQAGDIGYHCEQYASIISGIWNGRCDKCVRDNAMYRLYIKRKIFYICKLYNYVLL